MDLSVFQEEAVLVVDVLHEIFPFVGMVLLSAMIISMSRTIFSDDEQGNDDIREDEELDVIDLQEKWICPYCDRLNLNDADECPYCGGIRRIRANGGEK